MATVSTGAALDLLFTAVGLMVSREATITEFVIPDPLGLLLKGLRMEGNALFQTVPSSFVKWAPLHSALLSLRW